MALRRNIILSVLGALAQRGAALFGGVYVARYLGGEILGGYALILSNIYMFGAFATFGITPVASKYISESRGRGDKLIIDIVACVFLISLAVGLALTLFIFLLSENIALYLYRRPEFEFYLKVSAPSILFMALAAWNVGVLSGYEKFSIISKQNAINGVVTATLIILCGTIWGLKGIAAAVVLSQFLFFITTLISTLPYLEGLLGSIKNYSFISQLFLTTSFSFPHLLTGLSQGLTNWICTLLLSRSNDGLNELALFHIANQWYSLVLFIPNVAATVLLPHLSRRGSSGLFDIVKSYAMMAVVAILFLILGAPLISGLYGEVLKGRELILIITFITGAVVAIKSPIEQALLSNNKVWLLFQINLIFLSIFLAGAYAFLSMGTLGVLSSRLVGYVLFGFMIFFAYYMLYGRKYE
ncbi:oligosaccharide flippase family protein [Stutzerimonas nitrititolerans]|uniref:oligosaccharide flippase family protein n=1 Tax=Stutzerimonas nitrititolerans TaxID=2482751 RepID=UPI001BD5E3A2|nr:oligosaccharide flippase family protein [Stutzerimonas nitrititolerans]